MRRRLRLRSLTADLRRAFHEDRIPAGVAEAAARLPEAEQQVLALRLGKGTGLTLGHVREQSRKQTSAATAELADELFVERATTWQTTVRGHLLSAGEAVPDEAPLAALRDSVNTTLAEIERL